MKKLTSLLLVLLMMLSLAACGGGESPDESSAAEPESIAPPKEEEPKEKAIELTAENIYNYANIECSVEYKRKDEGLSAVVKHDGTFNYRVYPTVAGEFRNVQITLGLGLSDGRDESNFKLFYGSVPSNNDFVFETDNCALYRDSLVAGKKYEFTMRLDANGNYSGEFDYKIRASAKYYGNPSTSMEYEVISVSGEFVK